MKIKLKYVCIWFVDQLRQPYWVNDLLLNRKAWGAFSVYSHLKRNDHKPQKAYPTKEKALEVAKKMSYTAVEGTQNFVAVYDYDPTFDPALPAEPNMTVRSRLYLQSDPAGICTFNRTSGTYVNADEYVTLNITGINQGYDFIGWYQGDELISSSKSFNFMMTYSDATLTARFVETPPEPEQPFEPGDPSEPESQGGDIHNYMMGDVNNDKSITAQDASLVLQAVAGKISFTANQIQAADVNHDGDITAQDASLILQYVAGKISW